MRKFLIALSFVVAGCALPPRAPPPAAPAAPARPETPFEAWDVTASRLEVRVFREGPMANVGHNHVITSDALKGTIELRTPRTTTGLHLELPLESLKVDEPEVRAAAGEGFEKPVPDKDRDATRGNMLGPSLLDAKRQPVLKLTVDALEGGPETFQAKVRVGLRGEERVVTVPVTVKVEGGELHVHAQFSLHHADLGLTPFNVALGALRVKDEFQVDCRIDARHRKAT